MAIFQSSLSRKSNGSGITAKDRFKPVLLTNGYQEDIVLHEISSNNAAPSNRNRAALDVTYQN
jgi:hypothetical protein